MGANLSAGVSHTDIAARVALLGELTGKEFVQLGVEHAIGHKLALLANLGGHFEVGVVVTRRRDDSG